MENKKYLDLDGLNHYHSKLVDSQINPLSGSIDLLGSNLSEYKTTTDATIDGIESSLDNKVDYTVSKVSTGSNIGLENGLFIVNSAASDGKNIIAVTTEYYNDDSSALGILRRSTDGINWEDINNTAEYIGSRSIAYGNGIFCTEDVFSADGGNTWKSKGYPIRAYASDWRGICYDNGNFYTMVEGMYGTSLFAHSAELNSYANLDYTYVFDSSVTSISSFCVKNGICAVCSTGGLYYADLNNLDENNPLVPATLDSSASSLFSGLRSTDGWDSIVYGNGRFYLRFWGTTTANKYTSNWIESTDGITWTAPSASLPQIDRKNIRLYSLALLENDIVIFGSDNNGGGRYLYSKSGNADWVMEEEDTIHGNHTSYDTFNTPIPYVVCAGGNFLMYEYTIYGKSKGIESASIIGLGDTIINQINQTVVAAEEDEIFDIFG